MCAISIWQEIVDPDSVALAVIPGVDCNDSSDSAPQVFGLTYTLH